MIVSPQEYNSVLGYFQDPNAFKDLIRIPKDEPIYDIDLNTRKIDAPEFLSVEEDHNAEIVWFKIDRFYDNIDLYECTCWIKYINADKEEYFYLAPLIISAEDYGSEKILIPWAISQSVAKKPGTIQFAFEYTN